jgi:hypothetical protein
MQLNPRRRHLQVEAAAGSLVGHQVSRAIDGPGPASSRSRRLPATAEPFSPAGAAALASVPAALLSPRPRLSTRSASDLTYLVNRMLTAVEHWHPAMKSTPPSGAVELQSLAWIRADWQAELEITIPGHAPTVARASGAQLARPNLTFEAIIPFRVTVGSESAKPLFRSSHRATQITIAAAAPSSRGSVYSTQPRSAASSLCRVEASQLSHSAERSSPQAPCVHSPRQPASYLA